MRKRFGDIAAHCSLLSGRDELSAVIGDDRSKFSSRSRSPDILPRMPPKPSFTLGIEEEFQVVDPQTRELKSHIQEMFAEGEKRLKDEIKREMHDPVIEVG